MSFVVCSYNILANAYIEPRFFPYAKREHLDPAWRMGALLDRHRAPVGADPLPAGD